jgi:hypothetical protein
MIVNIKRLTDCQTKKSDRKNGYYIVPENWGSCFHRIATKKEFFEITHNSQPKNFHTYTKIPSALAHNVFHVYVNAELYLNLLIELPKGARIVGMYDPQISGNFLNHAYLIYCPTGEAPEISPYEADGMSGFTFIKSGLNEPREFGKEQLFPTEKVQYFKDGSEVIRLRPNHEDFIHTKYNYSHPEKPRKIRRR